MHFLLTKHRMLLVLLLLAAGFSVATLQQQPAMSAGSAKDLVASAMRSGSAVLIAAGVAPEESTFAELLQHEVGAQQGRLLGIVRDPSEAFAKLDALAKDHVRLDAIITSQSAGQWLVFDNVSADHPGIGTPLLLKPQTTTWPAFLRRDNLINIASQISVIAIIAIGMTLVIIAGSIDLSVGSLIALSAVLTCLCIRKYAGAEHATALGMVLSAGIAMLACALVGALNGFVSSRWSVPPFVVTLAMMMIASGAAYRLSDHQSVYQVPESFTWLGRSVLFAGLPVAVVLMLVLYVGADVFMKHTAMGRHLYAVGGNREAAVMSGLSVGWVLVFAHAVCGLFAGLGGVVMASNLKGGSATYGVSYEMYVIAAVVVGGTSLSGGRGRMIGTLTGAFIIAVIQNGMNLMGLESETQKVVLGLVILTVVMLDSARRR